MQCKGKDLVRCESRDDCNCKAGTKDESWFIGYVYCDHYDWHPHETVCNLPCNVISKQPVLRRRA